MYNMRLFFLGIAASFFPRLVKARIFSKYRIRNFFHTHEKSTLKARAVSLVFSHLGFWSGNLFLIAPFPDICLLVPFYIRVLVVVPCGGPKKSPRTSI